MSEPRQWIIKGGMCSNGFERMFVDGKIPKINESVLVIEKSAYVKAVETLKRVQEIAVKSGYRYGTIDKFFRDIKGDE